MQEHGAGVTIDITGLAADRSDSNYIAGSSGDVSLNALSRTLGSNGFKHGIRVVAISPGVVETERLVTLMKTKAGKEFGDAWHWKEFVFGLPHERPATVGEVAKDAVFVVFGRASCLNGIVINVSGGHRARGGAF